MKKYEAYKDSGLDWLGEIPAHWEHKRAKYLYREIMDRSLDGHETLLSVSQYTGVTQRAMTEDEIGYSLEGYRIVKPDDLVINIMLAWMGALGISDHAGIVSPAYCVYRIRPEYNPKFGGYLFQTPIYTAEFARHSHGIVESRWRMYTEDFYNVRCIYPTRAEQDAIVAFLDRKLADIDRFIANKQRVIALLKEQKAAIINRAVTRGIEPGVQMKPSGIEWLGEIPAHWEAIKLHRLAESLQTGPFGSQLHQSDYVQGGIPIINPSHLKDLKIVPENDCTVSQKDWERLKRHALVKNDIIFARRGEMGRCALVSEEQEGWLCGTGSLRMRPKQDQVNPEYFIWLLSINRIAESLSLTSVGSTMENLNTAILGRLILPMPPFAEQQRIARFIATEVEQCLHSIATTEQEIELIKEYRTTLIAEAVTGKIDVRATSESRVKLELPV